MTDRLIKACQREFERNVEELFKRPRMIAPGKSFLAEIPITGGQYFPDMYPKELLHQRVVAALIAREQFRADMPGWPELPVNRDRFEDLQDDDDLRLRLVAYFGESLSWTDPMYDYDKHPRFEVYARGLMAYEHTASELREDPDLQREFPPRELEGLCDGFMSWRTAGQIAFDRDMARRSAEYEARLDAELAERL